MKNVEVQQKSKELRRFQAKLPYNYAMIETGSQGFKAINTCFFTPEQKCYFYMFFNNPFPSCYSSLCST